MVRGSEEGGFAALVEQVRSEVRAVAEGHGVLVRGQEELRGMVASLSTHVGFIENAVGDGFKKVFNGVGQIKSIVTAIQQETHLLGTRLDAHERTHLS